MKTAARFGLCAGKLYVPSHLVRSRTLGVFLVNDKLCMFWVRSFSMEFRHAAFITAVRNRDVVYAPCQDGKIGIG